MWCARDSSGLDMTGCAAQVLAMHRCVKRRANCPHQATCPRALRQNCCRGACCTHCPRNRVGSRLAPGHGTTRSRRAAGQPKGQLDSVQSYVGKQASMCGQGLVTLTSLAESTPSPECKSSVSNARLSRMSLANAASMEARLSSVGSA